MQVALRWHDVQIGCLQLQLLDSIFHITMQWCYDGQTIRFFDHRFQKRLQNGLVAHQVTTIQCQQQVVAFAQSHAVEPHGLEQPVTVVAYGVNQYIAYIMDIFRYHAFLVEVPVGYHAGSKQVIGDGIYDGAVHLAGHVHVKRTCTGNHVSHFQTALLGYDRATHGRSQVINHQYHLSRMGIKFFLERQHDRCRYFALSAMGNVQIAIRLTYVKVGKQRCVKAGVTLWTRIYQSVCNIFSVAMCCVYGAAYRRYLHEIGTCARDNGYFHFQ